MEVPTEGRKEDFYRRTQGVITDERTEVSNRRAEGNFYSQTEEGVLRDERKGTFTDEGKGVFTDFYL